MQGGSLAFLQTDQIFRSIDARGLGYKKYCAGMRIELLSDNDRITFPRDGEEPGSQFWGGVGLAEHTPEKRRSMRGSEDKERVGGDM